MSGLRQHTIPRFLLRGFADDRGRVRLQRRGEEAVCAHISNVGVEKGFYNNGEDRTTDDYITEQESRYASLIESLRLGSGEIRTDGKLISELVHHLSLRTRSLRMWTMGVLLTRVGAQFLDSDVIQRILGDRQLVTKIIVKTMGDLGLSPESVTGLLPFLAPDIPRLETEWLGKVQQVAATLLTGAAGALANGVRMGHNDALIRLRDGARQASYRDLVWQVVTAEHPLVLGDSLVVMGIEGQQPFKAMNDAGEDLRCVYLPISTTKVMIGTRDGSAETIDIDVLNRASARCSYEFFVSRGPVEIEPLCDEIGLWAGLLSADQIAHVLDRVHDRWPFNPDAPRDDPEYLQPLRVDTFFPIRQ